MADNDRRINEPPEVVSTTEARQGVTGHNVRYVLFFSFCGAAIALLASWLIFAE